MNKEELAQMYQKANGWNPLGYVITMGELERFAVLVASAEREACAKVCDRYTDSCSDHEAGTAMNLQDAIRARGQA